MRFTSKRTARCERSIRNAEIVKILKLPDVREKLGTQLGMDIVASSPAELAAHMNREIPRWAALVKKSGASAD